jgi:diguanylate cyclase (GGDEF)-like protein
MARDDFWLDGDERKKDSAFNRHMASVRDKDSSGLRIVKQMGKKGQSPKQTWTTAAFDTKSLSQRQGHNTAITSSEQHHGFTAAPPPPPAAPPPPPIQPDRSYDRLGYDPTKEFEVPVLPEPTDSIERAPIISPVPAVQPPVISAPVAQDPIVSAPAGQSMAAFERTSSSAQRMDASESVAKVEPEAKPPAEPEADEQVLGDEEIDNRAFFDPQTTAFNFRYLLRRMQHELTRASCIGGSVAIMVVSIDNFEAIKAKHGQVLIDKIVDAVVIALTTQCRQFDLVGRYMDNKFLVVCSDISDEEAFELAESIRKMSESIVLKHKFQTFRLPLSIGIAFYNEQLADVESLIAMADLGSDMVAEAGGNAVCAAQDES